MEYVFLCAFVALIGVARVERTSSRLCGNDYTDFNTGTQGIWDRA